MLQGYVGNFFETGKLFIDRKTWLEAMPYRKSKKEPLCPIGTQCLSDIFEVRPKRVNLKYQQKTLQYIFLSQVILNIPSNKPVRQRVPNLHPNPPSFFHRENAKWPQMQFLNAVWQPIDTSSRSHRCLDKIHSIPTPSQDSLSLFFVDPNQRNQHSPNNKRITWDGEKLTRNQRLLVTYPRFGDQKVTLNHLAKTHTDR